MDDKVFLGGEDLLSKFGFGDGSLLDEILAGAGYDVDARNAGETAGREMHTLGGAVLAECVRTFLEPLVGGRAIEYEVPWAHNPIRLKCWNNPSDEACDAMYDVSAWVPRHEVLAIAERLAPVSSTRARRPRADGAGRLPERRAGWDGRRGFRPTWPTP